MGVLDKALRRIGLMRASRVEQTFRSEFRAQYQAAQIGRLMQDWFPALLSPDLETRGALRMLRARSRDLYNNNDFAKRAISLLRQNVIGPNGIGLQVSLGQEPGQADPIGEAIELAHWRWSRRGNPTVCGRLSRADAEQLYIHSLAVDGEVFIRRYKGFDGNPFRYAYQFIDPDRVDADLNRFPAENGQNEVRMGVEVDPWGRPVAYWVINGHPSEGGRGWVRVPASEMLHDYVFTRVNQTRGIPFFHTAMARLYMLGKYEDAEVTAARIAACMMGVITEDYPKEGDYPGPKKADPIAGAEIKEQDGSETFDIAPGLWHKFGIGKHIEMFNPQHPNQNTPEFVKHLLHGSAAGANISYASMTGDLRDVNFSSIRQGVLDERDGYKMLQAYAVEHFCQPIEYAEWLDMALMAGQVPGVRMPSTAAEFQALTEAATWRPRGWTWVDPLKDVQASKEALAANIDTAEKICGERGEDWKEVYRQRAREIAMAKQLGLQEDLNVADQTRRLNAPPQQDEDAGKSNGKGALQHYMRLEQ